MYKRPRDHGGAKLHVLVHKEKAEIRCHGWPLPVLGVALTGVPNAMALSVAVCVQSSQFTLHGTCSCVFSYRVPSLSLRQKPHRAMLWTSAQTNRPSLLPSTFFSTASPGLSNPRWTSSRAQWQKTCSLQGAAIAAGRFPSFKSPQSPLCM